MFLACSTGAFDKPEDCLAEDLLRADCGPVAILASSRVAMPYGLSVFATEALQAGLVEQTPTLGEVVRLAKVRALKPLDAASDQRSTTRKLLDSTAGLLTPEATIAGPSCANTPIYCNSLAIRACSCSSRLDSINWSCQSQGRQHHRNRGPGRYRSACRRHQAGASPLGIALTTGRLKKATPDRANIWLATPNGKKCKQPTKQHWIPSWQAKPLPATSPGRQVSRCQRCTRRVSHPTVVRP